MRNPIFLAASKHLIKGMGPSEGSSTEGHFQINFLVDERRMNEKRMKRILGKQ